jgi:hypothetical protein
MVFRFLPITKPGNVTLINYVLGRAAGAMIELPKAVSACKHRLRE